MLFHMQPLALLCDIGDSPRSVMDERMEEVNAEKIKTLEKYNDVLCQELDKKKEEAKDVMRKYQV